VRDSPAGPTQCGRTARSSRRPRIWAIWADSTGSQAGGVPRPGGHGALTTLPRRSPPPRDGRPLLYELDRFRLGQRELAELDLWDQLTADDPRLPHAERLAAERLLGLHVGLEVRVPFCDHRLVEYVFGTPWAYKTFDGREKSLLRPAPADLLPESVVQRVKSPYPSTQDAGYEEILRRRVAALLERAAR
jgi:hypothetical protein